MYIDAIPGSYEELQTTLRSAIGKEFFNGIIGNCNIEATFPDKVLVSCREDSTSGKLLPYYNDQGKRVLKEISYKIGKDGEVELGDAKSVEIKVAAINESIIKENGVPSLHGVLDQKLSPYGFFNKVCKRRFIPIE